MNEPVCICPIVEIKDSGNFVTEEMMLQIARDLRATVHLISPIGSKTVFGKHLMTCPCWTQRAEERNSNGR